MTDSVMPRTGTSSLCEWLGERRRLNPYRVEPVPIDGLDGWSVQGGTGNLVHHKGGFFSIEGLEVTAAGGTAGRSAKGWTQPIIVQPEFGILGLLSRNVGGETYYLLQAKMEPGNVNGIQLSPTVQATYSNYTRVHDGGTPPYLEHFTSRRGRVVFDVLQSEQGAWYLHKRNRNMIVEVDGDVPVLDDFHWVGLSQLRELLRTDDLVNMDTRTVLSGTPPLPPHDHHAVPPEDAYRAALQRSLNGWYGGLHDTSHLLSWFTDAKTRHRLQRRRIPLNKVSSWTRTGGRIERADGGGFSIIGVDVQAANREVARWAQPMLAPAGRGLLAFVTRRIEGVLHVLIQARTEGGTLDLVEMAPTVQCSPDDLRAAGPDAVPFLGDVLSARPSQIRHDTVQSEEGGRLYHAQNRYLIVEADERFPVEVPEDYVWMTVRQLCDLVRYGNLFNIEARCLIAALHTLW
ncbi:NDP-hexose 2,3-dehydratase family protein [Actinomadura opuntiae]|uniref:NDP-hexose 2,3-dehydratase family protein n=1 Tax=Actinomadura sp. OS1-43 TaxID=604315 RepID=UPI00255ABD71|nr:NDP-hexose 2,3-dehydratase family protein [Actinomadura sp. OS1-43]MDL4815423.1 NDP-hexose 2,3-dehydratase family protein [Actinomadura sp. OS1-43]